MRLSRYFLPTLKEDPSEAETPSHRLMLRSGMMRKVAAGVYVFLPLGHRVLRKVEAITREEMNGIGCQELLMPALQPSELWKKSGRWSAYGPEMMRLRDRNDREFCLGPTHEELITWVGSESRSYRDLPFCLYQIQMKFRDEIRPRFGVMRGREFLMKDAYSFHGDDESLDRTYSEMRGAYSRIVERCGLEYKWVKAASGLIGGDVSEEIMVPADTGEDVIMVCDQCDYAANLETAGFSCAIRPDSEPAKEEPIVEVETPGRRSVDQVAEHLGVSRHEVVKTIAVKSGGEVVLALVPGDRDVNETKLGSVLGQEGAELLGQAEFGGFGLVHGFVGPVGQDGKRVVADNSLAGGRGLVAGANRVDHHIRGLDMARDLPGVEWADIASAVEGDECPICSTGRLGSARGIEIGHLFKLGTKYSSKLKADFVDDNGKIQPFKMGCYGVGVSRLVAAAIEQSHDDRGVIWPEPIAPFKAVVMSVGKDPKAAEAAEDFYQRLSDDGVEAVIDDRRVSPGVKFSTADLIGIPYQIVFGKVFLESGKVEVKVRAEDVRMELSPEDAAQKLSSRPGD